MTIAFTHSTDARELDLEIEPSIDPGENGGRWSPSWPAGVEHLEAVRVVAVRLLGEDGQVVAELARDTLPAATAASLAREFEAEYQADGWLRDRVDRRCLANVED